MNDQTSNILNNKINSYRVTLFTTRVVCSTIAPEEILYSSNMCLETPQYTRTLVQNKTNMTRLNIDKMHTQTNKKLNMKSEGTKNTEKIY